MGTIACKGVVGVSETPVTTNVAMPETPIITAPESVIAGTSGYEAGTPPQSDCSYRWEIMGGTITSGAAGASIAFNAGTTESLTLTCTVTNLAGSMSGTKNIPILQSNDDPGPIYPYDPNTPDVYSELPDWVPGVGQIVDISLNTMNDVRGTDNHWQLEQQFIAWAGSAYAENYGEVGSLIFHTGGHTSGDSNSIYSYDIAARTWEQERPNATQYLVYDPISDTYDVGDTVTGWMWAADNSTELQVGEPFAEHTYATLTWLPPDVLPGSQYGYLYTPGRTTMSQSGLKGTHQPHKYAIGSFAPWTFAGTPLPNYPYYSFAFWDKQHKRVVMGGNASGTEDKLYWVDPATNENGFWSVPLDGSPYAPYYHIGFHAVKDDLYITARLSVDNVLALHVIDPATSTRYVPPTVGTPPSGTMFEAGIEWVEKYGTLVFYAAGDTVWTLTAPGDLRTGAWKWASQKITGTARMPTTNPPYTKFKYCPQYDLFLWPMTYDNPVQGFRIAWRN